MTIKNLQDSKFVGGCKSRLSAIRSNMKPYCHLASGDMLLSQIGNIGRTCLVYGDDNYLLNQRVAKVESISREVEAFLCLLFKEPDFQPTLHNIANGLAQQNLSPVQTQKLSVVCLHISLLQRFHSVAAPFISMTLNKLQGSKRLADTRNLLLPRLISGSLDVSSLDMVEELC